VSNRNHSRQRRQVRRQNPGKRHIKPEPEETTNRLYKKKSSKITCKRTNEWMNAKGNQIRSKSTSEIEERKRRGGALLESARGKQV
jgi:hypothetical protein